jgi:hypothetical protein
MQVLLEALKDQPQIAARIADAIGRLAEGYAKWEGKYDIAEALARRLATVQ